MQLFTFTFNPFQENTYVLAQSNGECLIIDPGNSNAQEDQLLFDTIKSKNLLPVAVLNTHCHIDHILGNAACVERYQLPLYAHSFEKINLDRAPAASLMWDVPYTPSPAPTNLLDGLEKLELAGFSFDVLFVPGHAPGHVAFFLSALNAVFSGDVLFQGSIGRTDLPGCNHEMLISSISEKMYRLPDSTRVFSGHGDPTEIGIEKKHNPFVRG
jgi:hydroxyacylglutathione hydrolase